MLLAAVLWNTRLSRKSHTDIISHPKTWHSLRKKYCAVCLKSVFLHFHCSLLIWSVTKIKPPEVNYFTFKHQNIFPPIFLCKSKTMITLRQERKKTSDEWWRGKNRFILCKLIYYCIFATHFLILFLIYFSFFCNKSIP